MKVKTGSHSKNDRRRIKLLTKFLLKCFFSFLLISTYLPYLPKKTDEEKPTDQPKTKVYLTNGLVSQVGGRDNASTGTESVNVVSNGHLMMVYRANSK